MGVQMASNHKDTTLYWYTQDNDPSTCCVQYVHVNIIPQDTRWLFNSLQHIYITGQLDTKQQCMVTVQKQKCLQALRPRVMLPLGYECYACKFKVTLWYGVAGSHVGQTDNSEI